MEKDRRNNKQSKSQGEEIANEKGEVKVKGKEENKLRIKSLKSFLELVRFEHGVLFSMGALVGVALAGGNLLTLNVLLGVLAIICVEMGIFAMNDYYDYPADKANKRMDRPIVRGDITPAAALLTAAVSLPLGNIIAAILGLSTTIAAFYFVLAITIVSLAYNLLLKKLPLIGNIFIGITMAAPFVFGSLLAGFISEPALFLAAIAFIVGVGRELMKDAEDVKGDVKTGGRTFPAIVGLKTTAYVVTFYYLIGVFFSITPFFTFFKGKPQYALVLLTDAMLVMVAAMLLRSQDLKTLRKGRKWTLYAIIVGLVAFLLASF